MSHVYLYDANYSNAGPEMGVMSTQADQLNCVRDTRDEAGISIVPLQNCALGVCKQ